MLSNPIRISIREPIKLAFNVLITSMTAECPMSDCNSSSSSSNSILSKTGPPRIIWPPLVTLAFDKSISNSFTTGTNFLPVVVFIRSIGFF